MNFGPNDDTSSQTITGNILVKALVLSVVVHLGFYGFYRVIKPMHWAHYDKILAFLTPKPGKFSARIMELLTPKPKNFVKKDPLQILREIPVVIQREAPLQFLPVDPMQATLDPPKDAKYYSDKNSMAANRDIKKESDHPNIEGKQTRVPFTMDLQRQNLKPEPVQAPQPRPPDKKAAEENSPDTKPVDLPEPQPKEVAEERPKPKGGDTAGNLVVGTPVERKETSDGQAEKETGRGNAFQEKKVAEQPAKRTRPRTLVEARARMQDQAISGEKMQQEGGVKNRLEFSALDAKATPFGAYDNAIVAAIQQCWYDNLDHLRYSSDRRGKVVVEFRLYSDGTVRNMNVAENSVGELLEAACTLAVTKPSPYPKWPAEMKRLFSGDYREVRFTFFYN